MSMALITTINNNYKHIVYLSICIHHHDVDIHVIKVKKEELTNSCLKQEIENCLLYYLCKDY